MSSTRRTLTFARCISTNDSSAELSHRRQRSMMTVSNGSERSLGTFSVTSSGHPFAPRSVSTARHRKDSRIRHPGSRSACLAPFCERLLPCVPESPLVNLDHPAQIRHFSLVGTLHRPPLVPCLGPLFCQPDLLSLKCAKNGLRYLEARFFFGPCSRRGVLLPRQSAQRGEMEQAIYEQFRRRRKAGVETIMYLFCWPWEMNLSTALPLRRK